MTPLLVSSGEPAGIGPDLCVALSAYGFPLVVLGDKSMLEARAQELNHPLNLIDYQDGTPLEFKKDHLTVLHVPCNQKVVSGQLNPENAAYVIELLTTGARLCGQHKFSALVTAPVHKANINNAGIPFTGHTEFLAEFFEVPQVVMMLACEQMRVALVTTHLPLSQVASSISSSLIVDVITQLHESLIRDFGIITPQIKVAGLNPHAGESGHLGREEIEIISPALVHLKENGVHIEGPLSADTMFVRDSNSICDAYVAMYHDQGLPVLKYAGFNQSVNITLGLPIIRTSVDHGTALELAGTNKADIGSMLAAVRTAMEMAISRSK